MILYILLIVFCGIMTLVALGLTAGGLMKSKRKLWISSLVGFVFFALLTVFASYTYVKKSIDYMATEEFQEETRQKAENIGKSWGNTVSGTAEGLAATLDEEAITKLANKGAKIVGNGVKAITTGIDETVGKTTVFSDESVESTGITIGRAEQSRTGNSLKYGIYLEFKDDFDGELKLTAYDSEGLKQDDSITAISESAGSSEVYYFQFENFHPGLSGYCILTKQ